jgi:hypothetical protein
LKLKGKLTRLRVYKNFNDTYAGALVRPQGNMGVTIFVAFQITGSLKHGFFSLTTNNILNLKKFPN